MRILVLFLSLFYINAFAYTQKELTEKILTEQLKELTANAEKGNASAQNDLGVFHERVLNDPEEAFKWYRKSAEQGFAEAQGRLGLCYSKGRGVLKNPEEAVKWYRKSAEQGLAEAQCNLGLCYANGDGVLKDTVEAYAYFNIAGITLELARKNRDNLEKRLTPSQLELGQRRSKELQKEIEAKISK